MCGIQGTGSGLCLCSCTEATVEFSALPGAPTLSPTPRDTSAQAPMHSGTQCPATTGAQHPWAQPICVSCCTLLKTGTLMTWQLWGWGHTGLGTAILAWLKGAFLGAGGHPPHLPPKLHPLWGLALASGQRALPGSTEPGTLRSSRAARALGWPRMLLVWLPLPPTPLLSLEPRAAPGPCTAPGRSGPLNGIQAGAGRCHRGCWARESWHLLLSGLCHLQGGASEPCAPTAPGEAGEALFMQG